jgi:hypothetical protein
LQHNKNTTGMDGELIRAVGAIDVPPQDGLSAPLGNSMAVSAVGDLLVLNAQGEVLFTSLRQSSSLLQPVQKLTVSNFNENCKGLRHLLVNKEESLVVLWSTRRIVVLNIPPVWVENGCLQSPTFSPATTTATATATAVHESAVVATVLLDLDSEDENANNGTALVKVAFHPLCDHSLVVLRSSKFLSLFDLRDQSLTHHIALPPRLTFNSFAFGPLINWLAFTVFLTTAQNQVYCLCPIVPRGALVSAQAVQELWAWHDQRLFQILRGNKHDTNSGNSGLTAELQPLKEHLQLSEAFLLASFGRPTTAADVLAGEMHDWSAAIAAGCTSDGNKGTGIDGNDNGYGYGRVVAPDNSLLALQGPFDLHKHKHAANLVEASADALCDLCTPAMGLSEAAPPVLVASYASGQVDVLLFDARVGTLSVSLSLTHTTLSFLRI